MKIRKGDKVKILSGKDRGKKAGVIKVWSEAGRITVEGINLKKRHRRSRRQGKKGEVVLMPHPIAASAAQLICPSCGKPSRVRVKSSDGGIKNKLRVCRKCGKEF